MAKKVTKLTKTKKIELRKKLDEKLKSEKSQRESLDLKVIPESFDETSRTLRAVATTNYPYHYRGFFFEYEEMLEISEDAIDLGRLRAGKMPALKDHDNKIESIVGRVLDHQIVRAEDRLPEMAPADEYKERGLDELVVTIYIEDNEQNNKFLFPALKSGLVKNISIGYRINDYEWLEMPDTNTLDRLVARAWELLEVSFVAVPADPFAGVRNVDRQKELSKHKINGSKIPNLGDTKMDEEAKKALEAKLKAEAEAKAKADADVKIKEAKEKANADAEAKLKAGLERAATITQIANETGLNAEELIAGEKSIEEVRQMGYDAMKKEVTSLKASPASRRSG